MTSRKLKTSVGCTRVEFKKKTKWAQGFFRFSGPKMGSCVAFDHKLVRLFIMLNQITRGLQCLWETIPNLFPFRQRINSPNGERDKTRPTLEGSKQKFCDSIDGIWLLECQFQNEDNQERSLNQNLLLYAKPCSVTLEDLTSQFLPVQAPIQVQRSSGVIGKYFCTS